MVKLLLLISTLFLIGCSTTIKVPTKVLVPVKCEIDKLERPDLTNKSISDKVRELLVYIELLENDIEFCRGVNE